MNIIFIAVACFMLCGILAGVHKGIKVKSIGTLSFMRKLEDFGFKIDYNNQKRDIFMYSYSFVSKGGTVEIYRRSDMLIKSVAISTFYDFNINYKDADIDEKMKKHTSQEFDINTYISGDGFMISSVDFKYGVYDSICFDALLNIHFKRMYEVSGNKILN